MGFLTNKTINYLNLHNGTAELLTQIVFVFGPVFLYQQGFSVAQVFFLLGAMVCGRIAARLLVIPFTKKFGLKGAMCLGLIGYGLSTFMLSQVSGIDRWFAAYLGLYMLLNPIYWVCFHMYYTLLSDEQHRGKQYAVRSAIILGGQAIFPIIGAGVIKEFGFPYYFALSIPIVLIALTFLKKCPNVKLPEDCWNLQRGKFSTIGVTAGFLRSFYELTYSTLWIFVIYMFLGNQLLPLSGIITFGLVIQVLWQLVVGSHVDKGRTRRIMHIGAILTIVTILSRSFIPLSLAAILLIEIINSIAKLHVASAAEVRIYNESHRARDVGWYWFFTEMARDTGTLMSAWPVAFLLTHGISMRMSILIIAMPALVLLWVMFLKKPKR